MMLMMMTMMLMFDDVNSSCVMDCVVFSDIDGAHQVMSSMK